MANDVVSNPGAGGATFATDEIGGKHYPKSKIVWGPEETANNVNDSDGFALPVQIWNDSNQPGGMPANPFWVTDRSAIYLVDGLASLNAPVRGSGLYVFNGTTWDRLRASNVHKDLSAVTITSITTVWTPASGKKFRLMGGCISVSAAASVLFEDNTAGNTVVRTPKLLADTPYNFDLGNGYLSIAANNVLKATASAAGTITGFLYGTEE